MTAVKPLLSDVFKTVETFIKENNLSPVTYNIEIKSELEHDGIFYPKPELFVNLIYTEILKHSCYDQVYLQSFDIRILQEIKKRDPKMTLALLVENTDGLISNLNQLGFNPDIYSPYFEMVDEQLVKDLQSKKIKLIPWTINEINDLKRMIELGVDGIITDYPDRALALLKKS